MCKLAGASSVPVGLFVWAVYLDAALGSGNVVEVGQRGVSRRHLVVGLCAVAVPLSEDEDGRLDFDDDSGHLEWRVVPVVIEELEELLVAGPLFGKTA